MTSSASTKYWIILILNVSKAIINEVVIDEVVIDEVVINEVVIDEVIINVFIVKVNVALSATFIALVSGILKLQIMHYTLLIPL